MRVKEEGIEKKKKKKKKKKKRGQVHIKTPPIHRSRYPFSFLLTILFILVSGVCG